MIPALPAHCGLELPVRRWVEAQLETIRRRMDPQGRCSLPDWSAVLQVIALLEQGLA